MPIGNEGQTQEFGLLGWVMLLVILLGFVTALYVDHVESYGLLP